MLKKISEAVNFIQSKIQGSQQDGPQVGIVLGSGLGTFVQQLKEQVVVPYDLIPHFKRTSVDGHEGKMIFGTIGKVKTVVLQGRYHAYEGHNLEDVIFPVRVLSRLGVKNLILTNAAGGINTDYRPGDLVIIKDHINLSGKNPLVGPNIEELGPRFPDMTFAYDTGLRKLLQDSAAEINYPLNEGVYCYLLGPTFETPAEIRMLRILGADMVGMSTVPETIAAVHLEIKVAAISCITNLAAGILNHKLTHEEVKEVANYAMERFCFLLNRTVEKIDLECKEEEIGKKK